MKVQFEKDIQVPRWLKSKLLHFAIPAFALIGAVGLVYADAIQVPNEFENGDILSADEMNENFGVLENAINQLSAVPRSYSVNIAANGSFENEQGSWIVSSQREGTEGLYSYRVNFVPDIFTTAPNCTCSVVFVSGSGCGGDSFCNIQNEPTTSSVSLLITGLSFEPALYVGTCKMSLICHGN